MDRNENEIFGDRRGFTLLELILVIGIIIILATASFGIYQNYVSSVQFNAAREDIISNLKMTRESAMSGMYSDNWGINYVNAGGYYKIFYTPTTFSSASTGDYSAGLSAFGDILYQPFRRRRFQYYNIYKHNWDYHRFIDLHNR